MAQTKSKSNSKKKSNTKSKAKTNNKSNSKSKAKNNNRSKSAQAKDVLFSRKDAIIVASFGLAIFVFLGCFGLCGVVGDYISGFFCGLFGIVQFVMPFALVALVLYVSVVENRDPDRFKSALINAILVFFILIGFCVFVSLVAYKDNQIGAIMSFRQGFENHAGGGFFGGLIADIYVNLLGLVGAIIVDLIVIVVMILIITSTSAIADKILDKSDNYIENRELRKQDKANMKKLNQQLEKNNPKQKQSFAESRRYNQGVNFNNTGLNPTNQTVVNDKSDEMSEVKADTIFEAKPEVVIDSRHDDMISATSVHRNSLTSDEHDSMSNVKINGFDSTNAEPIINTPVNTPVVTPVNPSPTVTRVNKPEEPKSFVDEFASGQELTDNPFETQAANEAADAMIAANASDNSKPAQEDSSQTALKLNTGRTRAYKKPPKKLLTNMGSSNGGMSKSDLMQMGEKLIHTLDIFGVEAKLVEITPGPAVTRFEIQPAIGVKVSKITNLIDDIKLNLAVEDVRIEAPVPGKSVVGIEVPNPEKSLVSFGELVYTSEFRNEKSKIAFAAGRDIAGNVIMADIAKMPHMLVAGSTGSGKSVCMNTIIMSILYNASPEEVKMIMIDPKVVELSVYNGIPHLLLPVVTDPKLAANALNWAVKEMMTRYDQFQKAGVRDIKGFNAKVDAGYKFTNSDGEEFPVEKMYQLVVIIDELADLMMVAQKEVEESICRIAQLARAAGIHLVVATQRPSSDIVTGLIKANIPSRIAFAVATAVDSRVILDQGGAERLLGKGDMLYFPQGLSSPLRVQGAFVPDEDVNNVVSWIVENNPMTEDGLETQQSILKEASSASSGPLGASDSDDGRDQYFEAAGRLIIEKQKGSIGFLQRNFKVGFNRAARIMDQLFDAGVVGGEEGTKPRKVLMTIEEFEQIL